MSTAPAQTAPQQALVRVETSPLITELAHDWKISPVTMINTLKATIFPQLDRDKKPVVVSNEIMVAFLQVCNTYKLNPFVKEIYAFPSKSGGIVPMVPVDGWANIINRNPQFDGLEFIDDWQVDNRQARSLFSTTCIIYRKDRSHPIKVTEYMQECYDGSKEPWKRWPARMLRHKALIQCARIAFSLAGIFDPDEAERIAETGEEKPTIVRPTRASAAPTTIDAPTAKSAAASSPDPTPSPEPQKGEAKVEEKPETPGQASSSCFCSCCKSGQCTCSEQDEFNRCGCPPCKFNVAAPPEESKTGTEEASANPSQPSGADLFPQPGQRQKPEGPYITTKQITKLIIAAKASGVDIKKDSHDDVIHVMLAQRYGITSLTEIPVSLYDEILTAAGNAGPTKVNAK